MRSFLTITLLGLTLSFQAQVGINTTSPSPASVLDVSSTNDNLNYGGFIPPRVNLIQRSLIPVTSNDDGMVIYLIDGTNRCIQLYDGVEAQWKNMYCMPINQAPVANSVNFTGDLHVGSMLIGSFVYSDAEGDFEGTHSYTWYRADDTAGTNASVLQTGTLNTYNLGSVNIGDFISFEVTPVATAGTSPGTAVLSSYQGFITAVPVGGVIISEIADPNNIANAKFAEVTNVSNITIDVSGWKIHNYPNGATSFSGSYTFPALTSLGPGASFVIANNGSTFQTTFGFAADDVAFALSSNGDDTYELVDNLGATIDLFGVIGIDGTGTCAEYENGRALRTSIINIGNNSWDESEWTVRAGVTVSGCTDHVNQTQDAPVDFTPGTHPF
jgi:hypothetical protein